MAIARLLLVGRSALVCITYAKPLKGIFCAVEKGKVDTSIFCDGLKELCYFVGLIARITECDPQAIQVHIGERGTRAKYIH